MHLPLPLEGKMTRKRGKTLRKKGERGESATLLVVGNRIMGLFWKPGCAMAVAGCFWAVAGCAGRQVSSLPPHPYGVAEAASRQLKAR